MLSISKDDIMLGQINKQVLLFNSMISLKIGDGKTNTIVNQAKLVQGMLKDYLLKDRSKLSYERFTVNVQELVQRLMENQDDVSNLDIAVQNVLNYLKKDKGYVTGKDIIRNYNQEKTVEVDFISSNRSIDEGVETTDNLSRLSRPVTRSMSSNANSDGDQNISMDNNDINGINGGGLSSSTNTITKFEFSDLGEFEEVVINCTKTVSVTGLAIFEMIMRLCNKIQTNFILKQIIKELNANVNQIHGLNGEEYCHKCILDLITKYISNNISNTNWVRSVFGDSNISRTTSDVTVGLSDYLMMKCDHDQLQTAATYYAKLAQAAKDDTYQDGMDLGLTVKGCVNFSILTDHTMQFFNSKRLSSNYSYNMCKSMPKEELLKWKLLDSNENFVNTDLKDFLTISFNNSKDFNNSNMLNFKIVKEVKTRKKKQKMVIKQTGAKVDQPKKEDKTKSKSKGPQKCCKGCNFEFNNFKELREHRISGDCPVFTKCGSRLVDGLGFCNYYRRRDAEFCTHKKCLDYKVVQVANVTIVEGTPGILVANLNVIDFNNQLKPHKVWVDTCASGNLMSLNLFNQIYLNNNSSIVNNVVEIKGISGNSIGSVGSVAMSVLNGQNIVGNAIFNLVQEVSFDILISLKFIKNFQIDINKIISGETDQLVTIGGKDCYIKLINFDEDNVSVNLAETICSKIVNNKDNSLKDTKEITNFEQVTYGDIDPEIKNQLINYVNNNNLNTLLTGQFNHINPKYKYVNQWKDKNSRKNRSERFVPRKLKHHQQLLTMEKINKYINKGYLEEIGPDRRHLINHISHTLLMKKGENDCRLVVDLRELNDKLINNLETSFNTNNVYLNMQYNGNLVTTIDLKKSYWQILMEEESRFDLGIFVSGRYFISNRLLHGLTNAVSYFMSVMVDMLKNVELDGVQVLGTKLHIFVDDIIIIEGNQHNHLKILQQVLLILKNNMVNLNGDKIHIMVKEASILGFQLNDNKLTILEKHKNIIRNMKYPTDIQEIWNMIGMFNFLARYIPNFQSKMKSFRALQNMLQKQLINVQKKRKYSILSKKKVTLNEGQKQIIDEIKQQLLQNDNVLKLPNYGKDFLFIYRQLRLWGG